MNKNYSKSAAFLSVPSVCVEQLLQFSALLPPLCRPPHPPVHLLSSVLLHPGYRARNQTSKQTEQQKNPSPRQGLVWAWGRDGGEILFAYWASSISPWWWRRPPRTRLYPHFCLTSGAGNQVSPQSTLAHHLLTQYAAGWSHRPAAFT